MKGNSTDNWSTQEWFHFREPVKGIVHPKMKMLYWSAYPKGIQDVGDCFISKHKQRFLTQTVAVCQSYNVRQWYSRLWEKQTYTDKTKWNPAARDDTLRSKDTEWSVCARNWTVFKLFFFYLWSAAPSNCSELVHTTAGAWRVIFLLYGGSQTYECINTTYLSNGPLALYLQSQLGVSMSHLRDSDRLQRFGVKKEGVKNLRLCSTEETKSPTSWIPPWG